MEIHPPRRIESVKDFLRELVVITAGILIALSLEGLVQWKHHRDLAKEARANLLSEVSDNRERLAKEVRDLREMQKQLQALMDVVHLLQANPKAPLPTNLGLNWTVTELHSTSWNTAITTGATSYMKYSEVRKYTAVYALQQQFQDLEERGLESSLAVQALGAMLGPKAKTFPAAELSNAEEKLGMAMVNVNALQQVATPLDREYDDVLHNKFQ